LFLLLFFFDLLFGDAFCAFDWCGQNHVEAFGRWFDGADDAAGIGFNVEAAGVAAGELEAVEQSGGSFDVEFPVARALMTTERATWTDSRSSRAVSSMCWPGMR